MEEEKLRKAFFRIKQDILSLGNEISGIKEDLLEIKSFLLSLEQTSQPSNSEKNTSNTPNSLEKPQTNTSTHTLESSTHPVTSTHTSTVPYEIGGLKPSNLDVSIGNEGVSTDRQTDRQTDIRQINPLKTPIQQDFSRASEILDSLDTIKKSIRLNFKNITPQEMLVFSTIYQLEDLNIEEINYQKIASKLKLSESSIRDYVQRLILKGIPITKIKANNKKISLKVSSELRKIASLDTIIRLKEI